MHKRELSKHDVYDLCVSVCGFVYIDIDECKLQNGCCSHTCTNSPGGHTCHCPPPLLLDIDNLNCRSKFDYRVDITVFCVQKYIIIKKKKQKVGTSFKSD